MSDAEVNGQRAEDANKGIADEILSSMREKGLNQRRLAKLARMPPSTVSHTLKREHKRTTSGRKKLERLLDAARAYQPSSEKPKTGNLPLLLMASVLFALAIISADPFQIVVCLPLGFLLFVSWLYPEVGAYRAPPSPRMPSKLARP